MRTPPFSAFPLLPLSPSLFSLSLVFSQFEGCWQQEEIFQHTVPPGLTHLGGTQIPVLIRTGRGAGNPQTKPQISLHIPLQLPEWKQRSDMILHTGWNSF